jgi:homoserine trans-succinylase
VGEPLQVLRFFVDTEDKRTFTLFYFITDKRMMMSEFSRDGKSSQNLFLPKKYYSKDETKFVAYHPKDFVIGKQLTINNITFTVQGCDSFTHQYYEELGHPMPDEK